MRWMVIAAAEAGTSTIRSTPSLSYHCVAICNREVGLRLHVGRDHLDLLADHLAAEILAAICDDTTEPSPIEVEAKLVRSVRTPTLIVFSPAIAADAASAKPIAAPQMMPVSSSSLRMRWLQKPPSPLGRR